ncbi:MAG: hypothetical protein J7639_31740 [Paenibacillaceae bacterium]|nr:hypothetical protein [Paenibacillaceae bacterium]
MTALEPLPASARTDAASRYRQDNMLFAHVFGGSNPDKEHSPMQDRHPFTRQHAPSYAANAAQSIAAILSAAKALDSAAAPLKPDAAVSTFAKREVTSSDPLAVTATARDGAERRTIRLQVEQTAVAQRNSGASFVKLGPTSLLAGPNRFTVERNGGSTVTIECFIREGDTHEQALTRMKRAINAAKSGINAVIRTDDTDRIRLAVAAEATGTGQAFRLRDESGNAVGTTGIAAVDALAANARYRLDGGGPITTESNEIALEQGEIVALLVVPTSGPVTLQVRSAHATIVQDIVALGAAYNQLAVAFAAAEGIAAPQLNRMLAQTLDAGALEPLGLIPRSDGSLDADRGKLHAAAVGRVAELERTIGAWAGKLSRIALRLLASTGEALLDRGNAEYRRYVNYRPSMSLYSQLPFDGILLNRFF